MIFVTVGTQAPFDRLIKLMDIWCRDAGKQCFAQIGKNGYRPRFMPFKEVLTEQEFNQQFDRATIVVSHAGMGTIISCLQHRKVLLTLPRLLKYGEHRNDHQISTTTAFATRKLIHPIFNENELLSFLKKEPVLKPFKNIGEFADYELIQFLKSI
jgi:UDP-N-acetylglucosamine transferase subunit ALG13